MQDIINITADQLSVTLAVAAGAGVDQVRVIVAIPEPSTIALCGLGIVGLVFRRHTSLSTSVHSKPAGPTNDRA
ncbi:MAG: PEP-CTERM sorting domain-containing protein [Pirellulales bacterium]